jgi:hypothetical protein
MAEQAAVNRDVVGSTPTGAAIHCRVDDLESRCDSESQRCWFDPNLGNQLLPCGVTGNIPRFERGDSRFKSWQGSIIRVWCSLAALLFWEQAVVGTLREASYKSYHSDSWVVSSMARVPAF